MAKLQFDILEQESPIVSQKVIDAGFFIGNFGGPSAIAEDDAAQNCREPKGEGGYESILWCAAGIIDSAAYGARTGAQAAEELGRLLDACDFPILKIQISRWICDICLVSDIAGLIPELCKHDAISKEFMIFSFVKGVVSGTLDRENLLNALPFICGYDYRASRYYKENSELYNRIFSASLPELVYTLFKECADEVFTPKVVKIRRTAFDGAPCKPQSVKRLELEYLSFSECDVMLDTVTSAVRYCDNLVRQSLGESSRLSGIRLSAGQRRSISDNVRKQLPGLLPEIRKVGRKPKNTSEKKKAEPEEAATEKLELNIDFGLAKNLFEKSFELSELFCALEDDQEDIIFSDSIGAAVGGRDNDVIAKSDVVMEDSEWKNFADALSGDEKQILSCLVLGGDIYELSRRLSGMPLGFADAINEKAQDICGDIVIEERAGTLCVISDYTEILSELIKPGLEEK